jgi:hypothetical protein
MAASTAVAAQQRSSSLLLALLRLFLGVCCGGHALFGIALILRLIILQAWPASIGFKGGDSKPRPGSPATQ